MRHASLAEICVLGAACCAASGQPHASGDAAALCGSSCVHFLNSITVMQLVGNLLAVAAEATLLTMPHGRPVLQVDQSELISTHEFMRGRCENWKVQVRELGGQPLCA